MIINPFDNEQEFTSSDKLITHLTQLAVDKNNVFRGYSKADQLTQRKNVLELYGE